MNLPTVITYRPNNVNPTTLLEKVNFCSLVKSATKGECDMGHSLLSCTGILWASEE